MNEYTLFMHSPLCQLQLVCTVQGIHSLKISLMVQSRVVQLGLIYLATIEITTFTHSPLCQLHLVEIVQGKHSFKISLIVLCTAVQLGYSMKYASLVI